MDYKGIYSTVQRLHCMCATQGENMASAETATLTFRVEPELKEAVRVASVNEHHSIANMIAVTIRDYCGRVGVEVQAPEVRPAKAKRKATPLKP